MHWRCYITTEMTLRSRTKLLPRAGILFHTPKASADPGPPRSNLRCSDFAAALTKETKESLPIGRFCLHCTHAAHWQGKLQSPGFEEDMMFPACWPLQFKMVCLGHVCTHPPSPKLLFMSGDQMCPVIAGCTHPLHWPGRCSSRSLLPSCSEARYNLAF